MKVDNSTIIAAILSTNTLKEAAKVCGMSVRALHKRRQNPDFLREYNKAKGELFEETTRRLINRSGNAVETVYNIMADCETPPQTRVNAAELILKNAVKYSEHGELLERLERLEQMALYGEDNANPLMAFIGGTDDKKTD